MIGTVLIGFAFVALWLAIRMARIGRREKGIPPGPPTLPVLGNLHMFPKEHAHLRLSEWAKVYGDIYSLKLGPGTAIIVSSAAAVKNLLDKHSGTTSDRPASHMADDIADGLNMVMTRYSDTWRALRKTAHAILTPQQTAKHLPIQKAEAIQLSYDILKDPKGFFNHIKRYSNSVIVSVLYGKRCPRYESETTTAFFHAMHLNQQAMAIGRYPPVDLLPILNYVPARWAPWKIAAARINRLQKKLYLGLLAECEERVEKGTETGCYMEEVVRRREEFGLTRVMAGYVGGVTMEGASDTTSFFLQSLILAFCAFPEAQRKAQEEIDRVVGKDRMPNLDDFVDLPYIQAVVKETHRFRPVAPLAVPHASIADEEYGGYLVPAGSTIFVNLWGIFHNEEFFERPEVFEPDRFIRSEFGTKPGADDSDFRHTLPFGCGRRICPGMNLANNSLMLNSMNLIWAFNFSPAIDAQTGQPIPPDTTDYLKGMLTGPNPFQCTITPRSEQRAEQIEHAFADAVHTFLPFEQRLDEADRAYVKEQRAAFA
ncbi:hypothetical protein PLICRDRAFT_671374 [Plicaturopsis crispa FD-325 SS-3]|uniref:Cytochrome P450 n=1 Tax=Plicaturopsis crispa FD-325 SS-3 TaxID=944288 RepID=A0A0C9T8A6_PLICR|nr:hypothetical protein PLICRDRAFT_671374 [Plicaturopsis crispa FD-325 SS-3]